MSEVVVDAGALREQVKEKYREVANAAHRSFHVHTGRPLAARLGYDDAAVDALPDRARRVVRRCRQPVLAADARIRSSRGTRPRDPRRRT